MQQFNELFQQYEEVSERKPTRTFTKFICTVYVGLTLEVSNGLFNRGPTLDDCSGSTVRHVAADRSLRSSTFSRPFGSLDNCADVEYKRIVTKMSEMQTKTTYQVFKVPR